jgi:hypothetical protein
MRESRNTGTHGSGGDRNHGEQAVYSSECDTQGAVTSELGS